MVCGEGEFVNPSWDFHAQPPIENDLVPYAVQFLQARSPIHGSPPVPPSTSENERRSVFLGSVSVVKVILLQVLFPFIFPCQVSFSSQYIISFLSKQHARTRHSHSIFLSISTLDFFSFFRNSRKENPHYGGYTRTRL